MNQKPPKAGAIALIAVTLLFAACKKDDDNNNNGSNSSKIVGSWNKTYDATDDNNNGSIDASEKTAIASGSYEHLTFYSNGTAQDSLSEDGITINLPGTYTVSADGRYVSLTVLGTTQAAEITQLDASNLIIRDTASHPAEWTIYVKR